MKKVYLLSIVFFLYINSYSQFIVEQNSGVNVKLTSGSVVPYQNVWICGYGGTVLRTTNYGDIWANKSGNGIPSNVTLANIYALTDSICLTTGNIGTTTYVYRTSNAGNSWTTVFTQVNGQINAINMKTNLSGFMCGNPVGNRWTLFKTSNGGLTWDSTSLFLVQSGTETGFNNSMACTKTRIWFGTNNSHIYFSSNYGSNWTVQSTAPEQNINSVWFYTWDSTFGFAGGTTLLKTTNSGINWIQTSSIGTGSFGGFTCGIYGLTSPAPSLCWYVRNENKLYRSEMGLNWFVNYTAPSGNYTFVTDVNSPIWMGSQFGIRDNGGITKFWVMFVGVKKISTEIPQQFSLSQNYPNPFNPITKIIFSFPSAGQRHAFDVRLIVYDILGHEVASLIPPLRGGQEGLSPGTYEVEWNGNDFPSGIYFYKLTYADFTETKKMILLK